MTTLKKGDLVMLVRSSGPVPVGAIGTVLEGPALRTSHTPDGRRWRETILVLVDFPKHPCVDGQWGIRPGSLIKITGPDVPTAAESAANRLAARADRAGV